MKVVKIEETILNIVNNLNTNLRFTDDQILNLDYVANNVLDSIAFITLVVELESEFGIEINDEDLQIHFLSNFNSIVSMVNRLMQQK